MLTRRHVVAGASTLLVPSTLRAHVSKIQVAMLGFDRCEGCAHWHNARGSTWLKSSQGSRVDFHEVSAPSPSDVKNPLKWRPEDQSWSWVLSTFQGFVRSLSANDLEKRGFPSSRSGYAMPLFIVAKDGIAQEAASGIRGWDALITPKLNLLVGV